MPRNDSYLYSGAVANSSLEYQAELRQGIKEKKQRQVQELTSRAPEILALLDEEVKNTELEILRYVGIATPPETVKETLVALNLYETSCKKLRVRIQNTMRSTS